MGGVVVMTDPEDSRGLLAQILAEVRALSAEIIALKIANAEVIAEAKQRADEVKDHEQRLRALESADFVTKDEVEADAKERARLNAWRIGTVLTVATLIETAVLAWLFHTS